MWFPTSDVATEQRHRSASEGQEISKPAHSPSTAILTSSNEVTSIDPVSVSSSKGAQQYQEVRSEGIHGGGDAGVAVGCGGNGIEELEGEGEATAEEERGSWSWSF